MLVKKKGFPSEGECVFCTVTKIHFHSVFVALDEYQGKQGMIHISEISPGRIRNIGDFVKEGKVIVCKVLSIKQDRGHIDLSLRRVNESQRRLKIEERKQEVIAENILQSYIQQHKDVDVLKLYADLMKKFAKTNLSLYAVFESVVEDDQRLEELGIENPLASELEVIIRERIKPKEVSITATLKLESYASNGVDIINELISSLAKISSLLNVRFLGAGAFKIEITAPDYEDAEDVFAQVKKIFDEKDSLIEGSLVRD